jgi:hypothetical protein
LGEETHAENLIPGDFFLRGRIRVPRVETGQGEGRNPLPPYLFPKRVLPEESENENITVRSGLTSLIFRDYCLGYLQIF